MQRVVLAVWEVFDEKAEDAVETLVGVGDRALKFLPQQLRLRGLGKAAEAEEEDESRRQQQAAGQVGPPLERDIISLPYT